MAWACAEGAEDSERGGCILKLKLTRMLVDWVLCV